MANARRPRIRESDTVRFSQREREFAFSVAMKYVKDEDEASDVAQDALLLAFRHRASFRGDSRFTTWLYRVAATTALMHLRKKRRMPADILSVGDEEGMRALDVPAPGPTPEDQLAAHEELARAREKLDRMGDKYGDVFLLRFRDGYSETEIAKKLRLNVATVKTRAYRARAAVRAELLQEKLAG
jgi:RNA polymerase sigma-70 factor, ECF subfamily